MSPWTSALKYRSVPKTFISTASALPATFTDISASASSGFSALRLENESEESRIFWAFSSVSSPSLRAVSDAVSDATLSPTVTPSYSPTASSAASSEPSGSSEGSGAPPPPQAARTNEAAKTARDNLRTKVESSRERVPE